MYIDRNLSNRLIIRDLTQYTIFLILFSLYCQAKKKSTIILLSTSNFQQALQLFTNLQNIVNKLLLITGLDLQYYETTNILRLVESLKVQYNIQHQNNKKIIPIQ